VCRRRADVGPPRDVCHRYLCDVPMLILDQPTITLAARGRHEVVRQILHLADERTAVLVSHPVSGVPATERILVLESGQIVEACDHDASLAQDGFDAEVFQLRAKGCRGAPI
jgi:ABC-type transport system involved in cytochrome bd biosynthesis fused ATPase/permease subunit